jgi:predicted HicB family RNase H-like nuclease
MATVKRRSRTLRLISGETVTSELVEQLAAEAEAGYDLTRAKKRRVGRPSLGRGPSPRVSFRVAPTTYRRARQKAAAEKKTVSELARTALEQYVAER